ncbi:hypothetical protein GYMLUDRAFT_180341 [Collybiopsis luxurians FD-317 M1]|uniref:Unplaced genomic scaffold GYMLUscaffold_98, whole genome shotgun sequence n=1 Tax=Collybiopsis luxurians FD-317 M1 TaxID=944289 RepID=A0A0D0APP2_9AGAR|nr:hypothetical protein GYMLUDRAFT_180341 [Collybiopsis luxurians FD-317 M1]
MLQHFNWDCIHMPMEVGGFSYIVQAVKLNILWPEVCSLKALKASLMAKFIYEDIICFVERAHIPLVEAIVKAAGNAIGNWPYLLSPALLAIQITASRVKGFSLYYLLYGVQPVLLFNILEVTWQMLDWDKVCTTAELLATCILQLQ